MFSLYQRPVSRYGGYRLNLSFDRVLRVLALLEEPELDDADKVDLALRLLVMNKRKLLRLNPVQKMELYEGILRDCIADQSHPVASREPKCFDFTQDADVIYSSFWLDYGIDLHDQIGRMHWRTFTALFSGLSERTKMREIMSIRRRPLPEPTKYNQETIRNLMELKSVYALHGPGGTDYQAGLSELYGMLERQVVKK